MTHRLVIAGIGEVLWDVYPDAARFGGAPANFACHAAALGAEAWMASAVGVDDLGDRALGTLEAAGVECGTVARDRAHDTGQVLVTLDSSGQASYKFADDSAWDHLEWSAVLESLAKRWREIESTTPDRCSLRSTPPGKRATNLLTILRGIISSGQQRSSHSRSAVTPSASVRSDNDPRFRARQSGASYGRRRRAPYACST